MDIERTSMINRRRHLLWFIDDFRSLPRQPPAGQNPQWPCGFNVSTHANEAYARWAPSLKDVKKFFPCSAASVDPDVSDEAFSAFLQEVERFHSAVKISVGPTFPHKDPGDVELYHRGLAEQLSGFLGHVIKFRSRWTTVPRSSGPCWRSEQWNPDDPVPPYQAVQPDEAPPPYEP